MNADNTSGLRDALAFVSRQPCRCMSIAQLGERDYCDRCHSVKNLRALLARTEAGADEPVAWVSKDDPMFGDSWIATTPMLFSIKEPELAENLVPLYTHPHDASAREADRESLLSYKEIVHRLASTREGCIELAKVVHRELDFIDRCITDAIARCEAAAALPSPPKEKES